MGWFQRKQRGSDNNHSEGGRRQFGPPLDERFRDEGRTQPERRDVVTITSRAADRVRQIQAQGGPRYLRLSVNVTESDGLAPKMFQNSLDLVDDVDPEADFLGRSQGISILIDRRTAWFFARGVTVDWVTNAEGRGSFRIIGAGESNPG